MNQKGTYLVILFNLITTGAIAAGEGKWQEKMKSLADTMGELLPELVSQNSDPQVLERGAKALMDLAHKLKEGSQTGKLMPPTDADPSLSLIASRFSEDARFAYLGVKQGQTEYAKNYLRTITAYCIACHTRHENGPQFPSFPLNPKSEKLSPVEKAELFVATRQFDRGLEEFQKLVRDENFARTQPFQWERPLRQAISISVRVKQDPQLTLEIIESALKISSLPSFQREYLLKWKNAAIAWRSESKTDRYLESGMYSQMKRLMQKARSTQNFRLDRSAEIDFLRASAAAHDLLRIAKNPKTKAEALFNLGQAYEALGNAVSWPMHELWYQACIRQLPHHPLSERCYRRLEESIYFGYTGSAGTHIPEEVQNSLREFKAISTQ